MIMSSCATIHLGDLPEAQTFEEIERFENIPHDEDDEYLVEVEYYKLRNAYYKGLAYDHLYEITTKIVDSTEKIYLASRDVIEQAKKIEAKNRALLGVSISLGAITMGLTTFIIVKEGVNGNP